MGPEQVCLSQCGHHSEEGLGRTHLVFEALEGVRQGMTGGETQGPEPEGVEEHLHLVPDPRLRVAEILVIKPKTRIDPQATHTVLQGHFSLPGKMLVQARRGISRQIKVADFPNIRTFDVAKDHRRVVIGHHAEQLIAAVVSGQVEHSSARF